MEQALRLSYRFLKKTMIFFMFFENSRHLGKEMKYKKYFGSFEIMP